MFTNDNICKKFIIKLIRKYCSKTVHIEVQKNSTLKWVLCFAAVTKKSMLSIIIIISLQYKYRFFYLRILILERENYFFKVYEKTIMQCK